MKFFRGGLQRKEWLGVVNYSWGERIQSREFFSWIYGLVPWRFEFLGLGINILGLKYWSDLIKRRSSGAVSFLLVVFGNAAGRGGCMCRHTDALISILSKKWGLRIEWNVPWRMQIILLCSRAAGSQLLWQSSRWSTVTEGVVSNCSAW